jgi:hypothetical protein
VVKFIMWTSITPGIVTLFSTILSYKKQRYLFYERQFARHCLVDMRSSNIHCVFYFAEHTM